MAELSKVKSVMSVVKKNQNTNKTVLKKANAKISIRPVEMPKLTMKVENLELVPKIQKTSSIKEVVKKPNNLKMVTKSSMLITPSNPKKQTLQSEQKTQQVKDVPIGTIPVHKRVETNKVDVKNKIEVKTVKAKTVPSKSILKSTIKSVLFKGSKQLNTDDVKQTDANNNKQSKTNIKKKLNSLSGEGKVVNSSTPGVKNE